MVAFTPHERFIGVPAKNQIFKNPRNTVYDSKRLLGRKYDDTFVQSGIEHWPFEVILGKEDKPVFKVDYMGEKKQIHAEEISSMVLAHMKETAESFLNCEVKNAVVTVPAYFNDTQRSATIDAARIAGLNVVQIINEPTAAALAYGLDKINTGDGKKNVLIFDLGGGTLDVTLLEVQHKIIEVKSKSGDNHLGGQDFDNRLVKHFAEEFQRMFDSDVFKNRRALARLKSKCEEVKRMLSTTVVEVVQIDALCEGIDLDTKISRAKFEDINADLFEKCVDTVRSCLTDAKVDPSQIDDVVLVGGSSRIPKIQTLLKGFLGINSFCKSINPDDAVAYGAAVQAAILGGALTSNIVLQDATPLSLGIANDLGTMTFVIPRNTPIPTTKTVMMCNSVDKQKIARFPVYEGERTIAEENNRLGEFVISRLPKRPKHTLYFPVTFDIDSNSILTASAMVNETGKSEGIIIHYDRGTLTKKDIDEMIREGEKYKKQDEERKQTSLAKNDLDEYAYSIKSQIDSHKLDVDIRKQMHEKVREVIEWSDENEYKAGPSGYRKKKSALRTSLSVLVRGLQLAGAIISIAM